MRAYKTNEKHTPNVIVFAQMEDQAKDLVLSGNWFSECEKDDIRLVHYPEAEKYMGAGPELLEGDDERSRRVFYELGWGLCESCGEPELEYIQESLLNDDGICENCAKRE